MFKEIKFSFFLIFVIILLSLNNALAHIKDSTFFVSAKMDKIEKVKCKYIISPFYSAETETISIIDKHNHSKVVNYKIKNPSSIGIGFTYRFIYFCLSTSMPVSSGNIEKYGNPKSTTFHLNFQTRHYGLKLFYTDYKFFYLSDPKKFYSDWNKSSFPKRPDIKTYTLGFYTNHVFSKKFSMNAAFDQSERQKKSGGSFIIMYGDFLSHIYNDSTMIPYTAKSEFSQLSNYKKGTYNTTIIAPGYGYSLIIDKFNFTPVIFAGTGPQIQSNRSNTKRYFRLKFPLFFNSMTALSYNGEKFFSCVSFSYEINNIPFSSSKIQTKKPLLEFTVGVRF